MSEPTIDPNQLQRRLEEAFLYLRIEEISDRQTELEDLVAQPDFWDNTEQAKKLSQELSEITEDLQLFNELSTKIDDAEILLEFSQEEDAPSIIEEAMAL